MTRIRRAVGALLIAAGGTGGVLLSVAAPAQAQAADVTSWWNAANVGDPAPAPPTPPDVHDGDLLVQGSNAVPVALPLGTAPAGTQAVAGLAYELAPTDVVGKLTLTIDGTPPPQVSVVACRATERFTDDANGPWSKVPSYDDKDCVPGALKDATVVFAQVSKLVTKDGLRLVLLPGAVDRIVFKHPGGSSLEVSDGGGIGTSAPPLGSGVSIGENPPPAGAPSGTGGGVAAPSGDAGVVAPTAGELPGAGTATAGGGVAPVVAPTPAAGVVPAATTQSTADAGMSVGTRRLIAAIVIALEVGGFLALMNAPAPAAPAIAGGTAVAGGRLRPPDRVTGGLRSGGTAGVGRFRSARRGDPPPL
jgi:hypothetical protein